MPGFQGFEGFLRWAAFGLALVAEMIAAIIITAAILVAAWRTVRAVFGQTGEHPWAGVRLDLGRWLALALEFLLAADVVRTAVAPTWNDIGKLAAIAIIRTALNYFLQRDIQEVEKTARITGERPTTSPRLRRAA